MTGQEQIGLVTMLARWQQLNATGGPEADALLREMMIAGKAGPVTDPLSPAREVLAGLKGENRTEDGIKRALAEIKVPAEIVPPTIKDDWEEPGQATGWLIKGWLPKGRVVLFAGEGGQGKSKLALMLAAGLAGQPEEAAWLPGGPGLVDHGPVVFATWEDSRDDVRWRLCDWPRAQGGDFRKTLPALLGNRLTVMDCARAGPAWAPRADGSRHTSTLGELTPTGQAIRADAERREARLLVLDPLAAAFACNENDRGIVRAFMADWDGWARAAGCTVLLVAHPPKSGAKYSGSTDWHGAARAVWTLGLEKRSKKGEGRERAGRATQLACRKTNYGRKPAALELTNWRWWEASAWEKRDASGDRQPDHGNTADDDMYSGW